MNFRDSEIIIGLLLQKGYTLVDTAKKADIVLFNGCSVRQHAENRVWSAIGPLKKTKEKTGKPIIGLIGCMAQNYQKKAFQKAPCLDFIAGPNNIGDIPELINKARIQNQHCLAVDKVIRQDFVYNTNYLSGATGANVIIMEGCNNFCSYCIVPYCRGRERSRAAANIISEIKDFVCRGITEITLLGQNVNSYIGKNNTKFVDLLQMVNDLKGIKSFDFVTAHPKDAGLELFYAMRDLPKLKKFLHLPVQSGSDRILKLMNRGYTQKQYLKLINNAREIVPNLRLTTDVMVGFPSETEQDFADTFEIFKQVKFAAAYIFKYSQRPHTKCAELVDNVSDALKKQRHQILLNFQKQLHNEINVYTQT